MDFRPNCKSCLYLSMVLQRPVGCEQHASPAAWSAAGPTVRQRPESHLALSSGSHAMPPDGGRLGADCPPSGDPVLLFSRAEYQRLRTLRARVQERLERGDRLDAVDPGRDRADDADGPHR